MIGMGSIIWRGKIMSRIDLIKVANETMRITEEYMKESNDNSPLNVEVYSPKRLQDIEDDVDEFFERSFFGTEGAKFYVVNADSFEAASTIENPLVMNFANAHRPGGGFLTGARAQEEALCRCSSLYTSISSKKAKEMYDYNNCLNDPCDSDYMLLSKDVAVFRDKNFNLYDRPFWVGVVTVPAPNKNGRASVVPQSELNLVMIERLRKMLYMAAREGYRNLVLGAWGTGAFGHDTRTVAEYFRFLFFDDGFNEFFENVVFAILDDNKKISIFKDVFGDDIKEVYSVDGYVDYSDDKTETEEDDGDMFWGYYQLKYDMPLCNHKECMSDSHLGFAQGVTYDGVPFEAELTRYEDTKTLCVVMPAIFDSNPISDNTEEDEESNIEGFIFQVEEHDTSILDIGMVDEGMEDELSVISKYVDFLRERDIFCFSSNVFNGTVFYRVDALGNDLVKVLITLEEDDDVWAYTDLNFRCKRSRNINTLHVVK